MPPHHIRQLTEAAYNSEEGDLFFCHYQKGVYRRGSDVGPRQPNFPLILVSCLPFLNSKTTLQTVPYHRRQLLAIAGFHCSINPCMVAVCKLSAALHINTGDEDECNTLWIYPNVCLMLQVVSPTLVKKAFWINGESVCACVCVCVHVCVCVWVRLCVERWETGSCWLQYLSDRVVCCYKTRQGGFTKVCRTPLTWDKRPESKLYYLTPSLRGLCQDRSKGIHFSVGATLILDCGKPLGYLSSIDSTFKFIRQ